MLSICLFLIAVLSTLFLNNSFVISRGLFVLQKLAGFLKIIYAFYNIFDGKTSFFKLISEYFFVIVALSKFPLLLKPFHNFKRIYLFIYLSIYLSIYIYIYIYVYVYIYISIYLYIYLSIYL